MDVLRVNFALEDALITVTHAPVDSTQAMVLVQEQLLVSTVLVVKLPQAVLVSVTIVHPEKYLPAELLLAIFAQQVFIC